MKPVLRQNETRYVLLEFLAITFLATGGIFVKMSALSPINTGMYRVLFAIPVLFFMARKNMVNLKKNDFLLLFFAGVFLAGDIALWNMAFHYTTVANANLLTNLTPFLVVPVSFFFLKEEMPKLFLPGLAITLLGVFVLIGGKATPNPSNYLGDLLAFGACFFYAGFILISYRLRDRFTSSVIMFISSIGTFCTLVLISIFTEGIQIPKDASELLPILGLTFCLQIVGHNLLSHCQGKLNVNLSSVICLLQTVVASLYSYFLFSETLTYKEIFGILIVILGVMIVKAQYSKKRSSQSCRSSVLE